MMPQFWELFVPPPASVYECIASLVNLLVNLEQLSQETMQSGGHMRITWLNFMALTMQVFCNVLDSLLSNSAALISCLGNDDDEGEEAQSSTAPPADLWHEVLIEEYVGNSNNMQACHQVCKLTGHCHV